MEIETKQLIGKMAMQQCDKEKAFFDSIQNLFNIDLVAMLTEKIENEMETNKLMAVDDFLDKISHSSKQVKNEMQLALNKLTAKEIETMINALNHEKNFRG